MSRYRDPITFEVTENDGGYRESMPATLNVTSKHGSAIVSLGNGFDLAAYLDSCDTWADSVAAEEARNYDEGSVAYLGNIEVDEQARGAREGRRLLKATLAWLDVANVQATFLYVVPCSRNGLSWADLTAWYKRHGFKHLTRQLTSTQAIYGTDDATSRVMIRVRPLRRKRKP